MRQERKRSGEMGRGKGEEEGFRGGEGRHGVGFKERGEIWREAFENFWGWEICLWGKRRGVRWLVGWKFSRAIFGGKEGTAGGCRRGVGREGDLMFPGAIATCEGAFFFFFLTSQA